jgi:16S rRNA (guanine527-N7)-methyltransferase
VSESFAFTPEIERLAPELGLTLSPVEIARLGSYLEEIGKWNASTNLTGNLSPGELVRHALESILGTSFFETTGEIVDIGSGGGFPGVPLAIMGVRMALLEPRERRAAFLRHVIRRLDLLNARVVVDRVERLPAASFSAASVRAVGGLGALLGRGEFLGTEGSLVIWTTAAERLASELSGRFREERCEPIPGSDRRVIALFRKCSPGNTLPMPTP